ncbi:hypothetical protein J6590_001829 [Homalodisca vitripennis]|nr:hypothetical protein J6590_001829 [Homalodisca vitripennis]
MYDTVILLSLYSAQMDASYWGDPEVFRPQRFLDTNGMVIQHDCFMPFGLGKRRCLGEVLAKPSLFLFLSTLLHCFTLSLAPGEELPTTPAIDGATLTPPRFHYNMLNAEILVKLSLPLDTSSPFPHLQLTTASVDGDTPTLPHFHCLSCVMRF